MKIARVVLAVLASCTHAQPQTSSVELPQQLPTTPPVATVHEPPPTLSAHHWKPPTPKNPPDVTQARQAFMRGVQAYSAGSYAQAVTEFETAYSYSPHEAVLYNIAAALEHVNRVDEAVDVYEMFADSHPPNETEVRKKIDALRK